MKKPFRIHLDHETPFWIQHNATFFITICTEPRGSNQLCLEKVGSETLKSIRHYHEKQKWFCHLALLMPDHIHLILSFPDIASFSPVIGDWKRWLTMRQKIQWQENFSIIACGGTKVSARRRITSCTIPFERDSSRKLRIGRISGFLRWINSITAGSFVSSEIC